MPNSPRSKPKSVAAYIAACPPAARGYLRQIRFMVREVAPDITERISYDIPTFDLAGRRLLYAAGWKKHVSMYPVTPRMISALGAELDQFRDGKGTLKFPLDRELPTDFIRRAILARVQEVVEQID